jgi:hypothetical protein
MIGGPAVAGTFSIGLYAAVAAPLRVRTALDGVHTQPCRADAADGPINRNRFPKGESNDHH